MTLNKDQKMFTAYVMALEREQVMRATIALRRAEFALTEAQHKVDVAKSIMDMAVNHERIIREQFGETQ